MSLFETFSDMSSGYADALDAGQYKFDAKHTDDLAAEPAPTVSLYNLLDHSYDQLFLLWTAVKIMEAEVRPYKLTKADTYSDLCAWALLLDAAMKEKKDRDSEAWAEKTAKEINETI